MSAPALAVMPESALSTDEEFDADRARLQLIRETQRALRHEAAALANSLALQVTARWQAVEEGASVEQFNTWTEARGMERNEVARHLKRLEPRQPRVSVAAALSSLTGVVADIIGNEITLWLTPKLEAAFRYIWERLQAPGARTFHIAEEFVHRLAGKLHERDRAGFERLWARPPAEFADTGEAPITCLVRSGGVGGECRAAV